MIQVNLHEAKAKLSAYLDAVSRGERVVIARRNIPVAELTPIPPSVATERLIGQGPRESGYDLPDAFWEPLPEEIAAAFGAAGEGREELRVQAAQETPSIEQ